MRPIAAGTFAFALNRRSWPLWLAAIVLVVVAIWVAYFFRDPERTGERGERIVIAPADGKVVQVTEVDEPSFLHEKAIRISIFMNVFNVHVNRYPVSGVVRYVHYNPGKFLNAAVEKRRISRTEVCLGAGITKEVKRNGTERIMAEFGRGTNRLQRDSESLILLPTLQ